MKADIHISVIICTYNRATYLGRALDAVAKQTLPLDFYEVIVVDNCSNDATPEIVQGRIAAHPGCRLRYIKENRLGLSYARNRGIEEATGHYIAYLDDDAIPVSGWLAALLDGFETLSPRPVCIGGKVILNWEGQEPKWVVSQYRHLFSCVDHGDRILYLNTAPPAKRWLVGANMAFDRTYLLNHALTFPPLLGRKGHDLLSGEESAVVNELFRSGAPVFYIPEAIVYHTVPPERRSYQYFVRRLVADGRSQVMLDWASGALSDSPLALLRRASYDARMTLLYWGRAGMYMFGRQQASAHGSFLTAMRYLGRTVGEVRWLLGLRHPAKQ